MTLTVYTGINKLPNQTMRSARLSCSLLQRKVRQGSLVHVYFKNLGITKYTKDRLFGWADLICKKEEFLVQE